MRKLYPLPNIQETLTTVGNFTYATVVDLVMGYYHMKVRKCQEIMWHSTTMGYVQLQYASDGFVYCYKRFPGKARTIICRHGARTYLDRQHTRRDPRVI